MPSTESFEWEKTATGLPRSALFKALSVPAHADWALAETVKHVRTLGETGGVTFMTVKALARLGLSR